MLELLVSNKEKSVLDHAKNYYSKTTLDIIKDRIFVIYLKITIIYNHAIYLGIK